MLKAPLLDFFNLFCFCISSCFFNRNLSKTALFTSSRVLKPVLLERFFSGLKFGLLFLELLSQDLLPRSFDFFFLLMLLVLAQDLQLVQCSPLIDFRL